MLLEEEAACPGPELHHSAGPWSHVTGIDPEMQELFRGQLEFKMRCLSSSLVKPGKQKQTHRNATNFIANSFKFHFRLILSSAAKNVRWPHGKQVCVCLEDVLCVG